MIRQIAVIAFAGLAPAVLGAQGLPAIRQLDSVSARSSEQFGPMVFVRQTGKGVLVNDVRNRRLLLLDSDLANPLVVADSTPATANAYSGRSAGIIPYKADSTLFVDASSLSMLVISPDGKVARVMSVPRSQDAMVLGSNVFGTPGYDGQGRLIYRGAPNFRTMMRGPGAPGAGGGAPGARGGAGGNAPRTQGPPGGGGPGAMFNEIPDTMPIVRVDLATRATDTLGYTKVPRPRADVQRDESTGRVSVSMIVNPLPVVDEWAVLSDGSVAIVRGRDYHVDWIRPDGTRESSPKMPFEWQRLTDEDKQAFLDSLAAVRARMADNAPNAATPPNVATHSSSGPAGERREMVVIAAPSGAAGGGGAGPDAMLGGRGTTFVQASELPDYKPPFFSGAVRADEDGRLWIRTIPTKGVAGGIVYDVVSNKGELIDRVQVPKNRIIVGFGAGGVVYLASTDEPRVLEKARYTAK